MKGDIIPNGEFLYKYVKPESLPEDQDEIPSSLFEIFELSCDWEKHQKKPEQSFHIREGKNLILRIKVCDEIKKPCNPKRPRQSQPEWEQDVIHDPIKKGEDKSHPLIKNYSHSLIRGKKKRHVTTAIASNTTKYKIVDISEDQNSKRTMRYTTVYIFLAIIIIILSILLLKILL